jgi:transcription-repair coupling factor (superfamily II helicase)
MAELKESEFKELFAKEQMEKKFAADCQLETDLELLIPEYYVSTVQERLNLYKELDSIETEENLQAFEKHLKDRFGPLPDETSDLLQAIRLRWIGGTLGFEKLTLKYGNMTATFAAGEDSPYFQSEIFGKVLQYIQAHPKQVAMKERNDKLILRFEKVTTVKEAINKLSAVL